MEVPVLAEGLLLDEKPAAETLACENKVRQKITKRIKLSMV